MIRSVKEWKELCRANPASGALGPRALGDLLGYRSTSLKRAEDGEQMANMISAIVLLTKEDPTWLKS